jgi:hypothetical protein
VPLVIDGPVHDAQPLRLQPRDLLEPELGVLDDHAAVLREHAPPGEPVAKAQDHADLARGARGAGELRHEPVARDLALRDAAHDGEHALREGRLRHRRADAATDA